jgi:flagellar hook assembly protein FlgD
MSFQVVQGEMLANAFNFPNPFDESGTVFSFSLVSDGPADVMIRVFTPSGRMIYERVERGLSPGYHQLAWDGRDHEGDLLGNGVYLCRVMAANGSSKATKTLRLVKLRKPHHASDSGG